MRKKVYYNDPIEIDKFADKTNWVSELECKICYMRFISILDKRDKSIINLLLKRIKYVDIAKRIKRTYYWTWRRIRYLKALFKLNMDIE